MMGKSRLHAIIAISILWGAYDVVTGYGGGAPTSACVSMTPGHMNTVAQTTPPPFEVTVLGNFYRPGQNITVLLTAPCPGNTEFQGFLLEARRADGNFNRDEPLGEFNAPDQTKHVFLCGTGRQAVTHIDTQPKSLLSFTWTAPDQPVGHIVFTATFATQKSTYWVKVNSSVVRQEGRLEDPIVGTEQYPTIASCNVVPTQPPQPTIPQDGACEIWKSCMADCTNSECSYIVSWQNSTREENTVLFELASVPDRSYNVWMAIGFSEDRKMGEDKVVECVAFNNAINVYTSFNTIYPRLESRRNENPLPSDGVFKVNASLVDGIFRCSFRVVTEEFSYINLTVPSYLLFATGRTATFRDTKLMHDTSPNPLPPVSDDKIQFWGSLYSPSKNDGNKPLNSAATVYMYRVYIQIFVCACIALLNGSSRLTSS